MYMDRWAKMPNLNIGRCYHASVSFGARYVFVLCGLVLEKRQVEIQSAEDRGIIIQEKESWVPSNTIERFDPLSRAAGWSKIEIFDSPLTARRCPGVLQTSESEISIFGGLQGSKEFKARYIFNVDA